VQVEVRQAPAAVWKEAELHTQGRSAKEEHPADAAAVVMQPRMHGEIPSVPVGGIAVSVVVPWAVTTAAATRTTKS